MPADKGKLRVDSKTAWSPGCGLSRESLWGRRGGCGTCRAGREQLRGRETSAGVFLMEQVIQFRRLWHCLGVKLPGGEGRKKPLKRFGGEHF